MEICREYSQFLCRWRFDILHPIDLVEEVAIGHGYDDLAHDVPKAPLKQF